MKRGESRFPRARRMRRRREFLWLQRHGRRRRTEHFVALESDAKDEDGRGRLGITASRRVGNAVARNRVKRRIREWYRRNAGTLPPRDVVIIARTGAAELSHSEVARELSELLSG